MASKNAELRVSTGITFAGVDQLVYMRSHVNLIDGLLSGGKILESLLPASVFDGMVFVTVLDIANALYDTSSELKAIIDADVVTRGGIAVGRFIIVSGSGSLTVSTNHIVKANGLEYVATQTVPLQTGDWIVLLSDEENAVFGVVNNEHPLATVSVAGMMSAADKTKLDGIATGANNYSHPTQGALSIDASDVETIDGITVNTLGHVTAVSKQAIRAVSQSVSGLMSAADKTKLDGIAASANNYVHPSDGGAGFALTLDGIERIAAITVNTAGHITAVSKENIDSASETIQGVIEIATATEAKAGTDNTRAVTPAGGKAMIDLFAGLKAYVNVTTADADIANNPSGKLALIYV